MAPRFRSDRLPSPSPAGPIIKAEPEPEAGPSVAPAAASATVDVMNIVQQMQQQMQQHQLQLLQMAQQWQEQVPPPAPAPPAPQVTIQLPLLGDRSVPVGADVVEFFKVLDQHNGHMDDTAKIWQAVALLRGSALQWWVDKDRCGCHAEILASEHAWKNFQQELLDYIQPYPEGILLELLNIRHIRNASGYIRQFQRLTRQLSPIDVPDRVLKMIFINGLSDHIRGIIAGSMPATTDEAMQSALACDEQWRMEDDEDQYDPHPRRNQRQRPNHRRERHHQPAPPVGTSKHRGGQRGSYMGTY